MLSYHPTTTNELSQDKKAKQEAKKAGKKDKKKGKKKEGSDDDSGDGKKKVRLVGSWTAFVLSCINSPISNHTPMA